MSYGKWVDKEKAISNKRTTETYTIYKHVSPNGKIYIGITSLLPELRYGKNGENYRQCSLFYRAICKYGWDNFQHYIIKTKISKAEAERLEVELISECKSSDRKYGYNIMYGGGVNGGHSQETRDKISKGLTGDKNPFYGKKHNQKTMEIIIAKNTGKKRSDEIKQSMSIRNSGVGNPNYGKHASEKTKSIWREQRKGRTLTDEWKKNISENSASSKIVICVETMEVFASCVKAASAKGIKTPRNIGDVCLGKHKSCGGYRWEYLEDSRLVEAMF